MSAISPEQLDAMKRTAWARQLGRLRFERCDVEVEGEGIVRVLLASCFLFGVTLQFQILRTLRLVVCTWCRKRIPRAAAIPCFGGAFVCVRRERCPVPPRSSSKAPAR